MRVLKGTLTFILGIFMGIILFVGAIVGTIYAVASVFTIGDLTSKVGLSGDQAIFDEDSDILDKTLWEVGTELIEDAKNILNMSINEIAEKYGLSNKISELGEISGIDISGLFEVPLNQLANNLGVVLDGITLNDIGEFAGMDFTKYGLPVLDDNMYSPVKDALDAILSSINGDNMTLRQIEDSFGITLGEHEIFSQIKDAPLSSFGEIINVLQIGSIIDANCDKFVLDGENALYVKTNRYEQVDPSEYNLVKEGAATYVAGVDGDNAVLRELRFVAKTQKDAEGNETPVLDDGGNPVYRVDNTCYTSVDGETNEKVYYRLYEYEIYNPVTMGAVTELYLKAYGNHFVSNGTDFVPCEDGYVLLSTLSADSTGTPLSVSATGTVTVGDVFFLTGEPATLTLADAYGIDPDTTPTKDSRLDSAYTGYKRVAIGTSDVAIQAIAYTTVKGLNNATDVLMSLKLGDLIEVNADSAQILQTLKDKPLNELSDSIDGLYLGDVVEISVAFYTPDANGDYTYVGEFGKGYYTLYNPEEHAGLPRYSAHEGTGLTETPNYVLANASQLASTATKYYWNTAESALKPVDADTPADAPLYVMGTASSKVLQRLANVSIGDFSTSFDNLILGDVIDVDMDTYEVLPQGFDFDTASPFDEFFYFEDDMYHVSEDPVADSATKTLYRLVEESDSSAILKKLALAKVNDLSAKMETLLDEMRLDEVMDIEPVLYMPNDNGNYVYVKDGGYYTLYNAAIHTDGQRYMRVTDGDFTYRPATDDDSALTKYYWDSVNHKMVTDGSGTAYVQTSYSSLMLQRFAKVKINGFSNALDGLALSDVMEIDADVYEKVADTSDPNRTYYYYDEGLYVQATADYITANPDATYYAIDSVGTSHIVMKKMAYLPVNELGTRMNDVINDLYLADLMDIHEFDVVEYDDANHGAQGDYFVPVDTDYNEFHDGEPDPYHYSFIRDDNGKYYLKDKEYFALSSAQADLFKSATESVTFVYQQLTKDALGANETLFLTQAALGNAYFLTQDGVYHNNPALCAYIISQGKMNNNSTDYEKVFIRVAAEPGTEGAITLNTYVNPTYNGHDMLYVKVNGSYVSYNTALRDELLPYAKLVHVDLEKYVLLSNGYALIEENANDTRDNLCYYDVENFTFTADAVTKPAKYLPLVKNSIKGSTISYNGSTFDTVDAYYYGALDSAYRFAKSQGVPVPTYSKQLATTVYVATADKDGADLAFYNDKLVEKDTVPEDAVDVTYVKAEVGYIVNIQGSDVITFLNAMTGERKINVLQAQSAAALKAFAAHDVKVSSLDSSLKDFTISDMMDIAPDSLFDDEEIKNAKIDDLGNVFQNKMQHMTIQNILDWGNITTLSDEVLAIIGDATLEDFFASLTYDTHTGITVNIVTLYTSIYERQRTI